MDISIDTRWRVMVSSTMHDLELERLATQRAISDAGMDPWMTEHLPAEFASDTPREFCRNLAERCDLFLLILGPNYGFTPDRLPADTGQSVTQLEFGWARGDSLYKFRIFMRSDAQETEDERQRAFIATALDFDTGHVRSTPFSSPDELYYQVAEALEDWKKTHSLGLERYIRTVRDKRRYYFDPIMNSDFETDDLVELALEDMSEEDTEEEDTEEEDTEEEDTEEEDTEPGATSYWASVPSRSRNKSNQLASKAVLDKLFGSSARAVLLGAPGSGKSVFSHQLTYWLTRDALNSDISNRPPIPIPLQASRLAAQLANGASLSEAVRRVAVDESSPEAEFALEVALQTGDAILLVDGLDQIGSLTLRRLVTSTLEQLGKNRILLTTRPSALELKFADSWHPFRLAGLDIVGQSVVVAHAIQGLSGENAQQADQHAEDLLLEIEQHRYLREWAESPLLLTMLATQYQRRGSVPKQRADVYRFAILQMMGARGRTTDAQFRDDKLLLLLGNLALYMMDNYLDEATEEQLAKWAATVAGGTERKEWRILLEESAILQQTITGNWNFVHFSFQEYLAALALASSTLAARTNRIIGERLNPWWDGTALLLVSELDSTNRSDDADKVIMAHLAADRQRISAVGGRDPSHLSLVRATRCYLVRTSEESIEPDRIVHKLGKQWASILYNVSGVRTAKICTRDDLGDKLSQDGYGSLYWTFGGSGSDPDTRQEKWLEFGCIVVLAVCVLFVVGQLLINIPLLEVTPPGVLARTWMPVFVLTVGLISVALTSIPRFVRRWFPGNLKAFASLTVTLVDASSFVSMRQKQIASEIHVAPPPSVPLWSSTGEFSDTPTPDSTLPESDQTAMNTPLSGPPPLSDAWDPIAIAMDDTRESSDAPDPQSSMSDYADERTELRAEIMQSIQEVQSSVNLVSAALAGATSLLMIGVLGVIAWLWSRIADGRTDTLVWRWLVTALVCGLILQIALLLQIRAMRLAHARKAAIRMASAIPIYPQPLPTDPTVQQREWDDWQRRWELGPMVRIVRPGRTDLITALLVVAGLVILGGPRVILVAFDLFVVGRIEDAIGLLLTGQDASLSSWLSAWHGTDTIVARVALAIVAIVLSLLAARFCIAIVRIALMYRSELVTGLAVLWMRLLNPLIAFLMDRIVGTGSSHAGGHDRDLENTLSALSQSLREVQAEVEASTIARQLLNESVPTRLHAVREVFALDPHGALPALQFALRDPDLSVRAAACRSLRSLGPKAAPAARELVVLAMARDRDRLLEILPSHEGITGSRGQASETGAEQAIDEDPNQGSDSAVEEWMVRSLATEALVAMGSSASATLPTLLNVLFWGSPERQQRAVVVLSAMDSLAPQVIPELRRLLQTGVGRLRRNQSWLAAISYIVLLDQVVVLLPPSLFMSRRASLGNFAEQAISLILTVKTWSTWQGWLAFIMCVSVPSAIVFFRSSASALDRSITKLCCLALLKSFGSRATAAMPELLAILRDNNEILISAACQAVAAMGSAGKPALRQLDLLARHSLDSDIRESAAAAFIAILASSNQGGEEIG